MTIQQTDTYRQAPAARIGLPGWLKKVIAAGLLLFSFACSSCAEQPVIGDMSTTGTRQLIRFESLDDGVSGVVYRTVNDLDKLIAQSDVPVLIAFYQPQDGVNSLVIPCLEQMADDYQNRVQIVWINARAHQSTAASFSVEQYPHFTVVVNASLKQALAGFDEQGCVRLRTLLDRYTAKDS